MGLRVRGGEVVLATGPDIDERNLEHHARSLSRPPGSVQGGPPVTKLAS